MSRGFAQFIPVGAALAALLFTGCSTSRIVDPIGRPVTAAEFKRFARMEFLRPAELEKVYLEAPVWKFKFEPEDEMVSGVRRGKWRKVLSAETKITGYSLADENRRGQPGGFAGTAHYITLLHCETTKGPAVLRRKDTATLVVWRKKDGSLHDRAFNAPGPP